MKQVTTYFIALWKVLWLFIRGQKRYRLRISEIRQMDATECGSACLTMILNYYGRRTRLSEVRERCGVGRDGLSARAIVKAARDYGLRVRAFSQQHSDFRYVQLPAIVHWRFNHFLIVERWSPKRVDIVDPAAGRRRVSSEEFDNNFTGVVITLQPGAQFSHEGSPLGLSLWSYVRQMFRQPGMIVQLLGASLLLQALGLAQPALTQIIIDQIIPGNMKDIMLLIGLGMLTLVLAQMITTLLRATILIYLQAHIDSQMMLNFFEHLLTLPYHFFQQRLSGDLLTRLSSNMAIRDLFTNQLISSVLDGSFVSVYLAILFWQSRIYGFLALGLGMAQIILLFVTTRPVREWSRKELETQGKAQGYMNEVLAGIATIKAAGAEPRAFERWTNHFFEQLNVSLRRSYISSLVDTLLGALRVLAPLLMLWVGTQLVLSNRISLGTMLALNSLVMSFMVPLSSLVNSGQRVQQVRAHFERIADVLEEKPEQALNGISQPPSLSGDIDLRNVSFRYDPYGKLILKNINLSIKSGQKIALVGHTGSGKSTLGRLLLALYLPTEGEILYDGLPLKTLQYQEVRKQFGIVLQEASIFSGSIRDNIAFNNPDIDMQRVVWAARMAAIHEDIIHMPMQYETLVSEAGSALSGGQRQRLSIARALAHKPSLILFDEATSHLDVITENIVEQNLRGIYCTRIIIAHRLSTIRNADLILVLTNGEIVESGTHIDLLQSNGYYAQLVCQQIENGEEEEQILFTKRVDKLKRLEQAKHSHKIHLQPLSSENEGFDEIEARGAVSEPGMLGLCPPFTP